LTNNLFDPKLKSMLKKLLIFLPFFTLLLTPVAYASVVYPDSYGGTNNQYYTVVFDGEGEAAVVVRLDLTNNSQSVLSNMVLEIPGKSLRIINAVQEYTENRTYYPTTDPSSGAREIDPAIYPNYNYGGHYSLKPEQSTTQSGFRVSLKLVDSLKQQESTSLLVYYKVSGYVTNLLGVRNFDFQTIKTDFDVDTVRVAVNAQEPFKIKGAKASTNYLPSFSPLESGKTYSGTADSSLSEFSGRIVSESGFVKQTQGLDPGENFIVKGSYSESVFLLYLVDLVKWLLIAGSVALIAYLVYRWWYKKHRLENKFNQIHPLVKVVGVSTASTILLGVVFFLSVWLIERYGSLGGNYDLIPFLVLLLLFIFVVILVFGPALYFGIRYGIRYGLFAIGTSIGLLIIALIFTFVLIAASSSPIYPEPLGIE